MVYIQETKEYEQRDSSLNENESRTSESANTSKNTDSSVADTSADNTNLDTSGTNDLSSTKTSDEDYYETTEEKSSITDDAENAENSGDSEEHKGSENNESDDSKSAESEEEHKHSSSSDDVISYEVEVKEAEREEEESSESKSREFLTMFSEDVSCPHCLKYFGPNCTPMIFPCGHNICSTCFKNKEIKKCFQCNADWSKCTSENVFKNLGLLEMICELKRKRIRHEVSLAKFADDIADDAFFRAANLTKELKDEYFLNPLINIQRDVETKFTAITSFLDVFKDYKENLEGLLQENAEFLETFKVLRTKLLKSEDIVQYHENIIEVSKALKKNSDIFQDHKLYALENATKLRKKLSDFIALNESKLTLERGSSGELLPDRNVKYLYYKDSSSGKETQGKRLHAEIDVEDNHLHISSFKNYFPYGLSLFFNFEEIESHFVTRDKKLFLDIVLKEESGGRNPSRIYITPETNNNTLVFQDFFSGRNGETFHGADITTTQDFLIVQHFLIDSDTVVNKAIFKDTSAKIELQVGAVFIDLNDEDNMFKICRRPMKKIKCLLMGQITSGVRELKKLKGDCYVENCGVYITEASDILGAEAFGTK